MVRACDFLQCFALSLLLFIHLAHTHIYKYQADRNIYIYFLQHLQEVHCDYSIDVDID